MSASHGQKKKYEHSVIGCNSRLDTLQAAVLNVKLKYLDDYISSRRDAAKYYYEKLNGVAEIELPKTMNYSAHTFNQFTLKVKNGKRDKLHAFLKENGIPTIIYYPLPLYKQEAFKTYCEPGFELPITEELCNSVLSIPMHTELTTDIQDKITDTIKSFY